MNNEFLASLDKLIDAEPKRLAAQKAEDERLAEAGRRDKEHVDALKPKIDARLKEVLATWNGCLEAIQHKSRDLGFVADISSGREDEWHVLQINFHLHSGGHAQPLKLTVTQRGMAEFDPNRATSFDFLRAGMGVFEANLLKHVTDVFHQARDRR